MSMVVVACGGTNADLTTEGTVASDEAGATTWPEGASLLAEFRPGGDAVVRFYEMENGDIAAMGRIDDGEGGVLPGTSEQVDGGLAELYRHVAGAKADPELLARLMASDESTRSRLDSPEQLEVAHVEGDPGELSLSSEERTAQAAQTCSFQSDAFYAADAATFATNFCRTLDGLPSIHCETNHEGWVDGWHRAKKYRSDAFNQTLCNRGTFKCQYRYDSTFGQFFHATVGPRERWFCTWNTSRGDQDFHAELTDLDGPERAHLCISVNRKQ
jgi:hypothetical protein